MLKGTMPGSLASKFLTYHICPVVNAHPPRVDFGAKQEKAGNIVQDFIQGLVVIGHLPVFFGKSVAAVYLKAEGYTVIRKPVVDQLDILDALIAELITLSYRRESSTGIIRLI